MLAIGLSMTKCWWIGPHWVFAEKRMKRPYSFRDKGSVCTDDPRPRCDLNCRLEVMGLDLGKGGGLPLGIKNIVKFSIKIPHFTSTVYHLLLSVWSLCWIDTILGSYHFPGFSWFPSPSRTSVLPRGGCKNCMRALGEVVKLAKIAANHQKTSNIAVEVR